MSPNTVTGVGRRCRTSAWKGTFSSAYSEKQLRATFIKREFASAVTLDREFAGGFLILVTGTPTVASKSFAVAWVIGFGRHWSSPRYEMASWRPRSAGSRRRQLVLGAPGVEPAGGFAVREDPTGLPHRPVPRKSSRAVAPARRGKPRWPARRAWTGSPRRSSQVGRAPGPDLGWQAHAEGRFGHELRSGTARSLPR